MKTVPLYGKHAAGRVALVSDQKYDLVMRYLRCVDPGSAQPGNHHGGPYVYARRRENGRERKIYMHKLITGWARVDHQNGNGLDNQDHNLRKATAAQNAYNRKLRTDNTSGYKGVHWHAKLGKWRARIGIDGTRRHLGLFTDPAEAARAYDAAAKEAFGEFARLNFPEPGNVRG